METQKYLWLTSWYPNRNDRFDGDFIQRHAQAVSAFCNIHVIHVQKEEPALVNQSNELNSTGNLSENIIYYSCKKTGIAILDKWISHRNYIRCYKKAITNYILENGKPVAVHVHVAMKAGLVALWIKRKWGIPYVVTEHWTGYYRQGVPSLYDQNPVYRFKNKRVLKDAELFLPVSKDLGETVQREFISVDYKVIPNVVDSNLFYFKPQERKVFRFIHVSLMNYQKNPEGIIMACSMLKEKGYLFELLMVGNKDERLIQFSAELGLTDKEIYFESTVPYSEVARRMQESSVLLLFSRFENLPCVILEALCCGLPVISSLTGGIAEVVDANNGILIKSENINELVMAMQKMMDNYAFYDRKDIAEKAVVKFKYDTVARQLMAIYEQLPLMDRS